MEYTIANPAVERSYKLTKTVYHRLYSVKELDKIDPYLCNVAWYVLNNWVSENEPIFRLKKHDESFVEHTRTIFGKISENAANTHGLLSYEPDYMGGYKFERKRGKAVLSYTVDECTAVYTATVEF